MELVALVLLPQITLLGLTLLPHSTLKPLHALLPQITEDPHNTDWPKELLPQITELPQTIELPQRTELPQSTELPVTRTTCPVDEL